MELSEIPKAPRDVWKKNQEECWEDGYFAGFKAGQENKQIINPYADKEGFTLCHCRKFRASICIPCLANAKEIESKLSRQDALEEVEKISEYGYLNGYMRIKAEDFLELKEKEAGK